MRLGRVQYHTSTTHVSGLVLDTTIIKCAGAGSVGILRSTTVLFNTIVNSFSVLGVQDTMLPARNTFAIGDGIDDIREL